MEVGREFGFASRVVTSLLGPVLAWSARREERRLLAGRRTSRRPIIERRNWSGQVEELPLAELQCAEEVAG